jgi:hypothetical protein
VCAYIKHCHLYTEIYIANRGDLFEISSVCITSFDVSYCICVCYHPPQTFYPASTITELLHDVMQQRIDQFSTGIIGRIRKCKSVTRE